MSQRTKSSKAPAKDKPKDKPAPTPTFDPDVPWGGSFCGHYPGESITKCTTVDQSVFDYSRGSFLPGEHNTQSAVYFGGPFRMACGGCGFVPEPFALYKLERHCIGQSDRGGCPAFMAKYHQQLHIFRPTFKDDKGKVQRHPFFRANYLPTFGLLTDNTSKPVDRLKEIDWLQQFKRQIDYNIDNKIASRGFQFYRYPNKSIPELLPTYKVEVFSRGASGILFVSIEYEDNPSLPLMIEQLKARRRELNLSEEDWVVEHQQS
ncbi:MAG: hypothetical protein ACPGYJ_10470, partial [bacterium]